jgi:hypothetical protein
VSTITFEEAVAVRPKIGTSGNMGLNMVKCV